MTHRASRTLLSWQLACAALAGLGLAAACVPKSSRDGVAGAEASGIERKRIPRPPNNRTPPVARYGQLAVRGSALVGANGAPVVLRGQAFGWDNWWPQYYNADVVQWLRDDWCVDVVRPAMGIEPEDRKSVV